MYGLHHWALHMLPDHASMEYLIDGCRTLCRCKAFQVYQSMFGWHFFAAAVELMQWYSSCTLWGTGSMVVPTQILHTDP
jgi:hypothetical protein